jgi:hypothetical protein
VAHQRPNDVKNSRVDWATASVVQISRIGGNIRTRSVPPHVPIYTQISAVIDIFPRPFLLEGRERRAIPRKHVCPLRPLEAVKTTVPLRPHLVRVHPPAALLVGIRVEALRVAFPTHRRCDGASVSARVHVVPAHGGEEGVVFHARRAPENVAEAVGAIDRAEAEDEILCQRRYL